MHALDTPGSAPFHVTDYITHVVYVRQGRIDPCVPALEQMGIHCLGVDANEENPRLDEQRTYMWLTRVLRSAFEEMVVM